MIGQHFYHSTIRNTVAVFGSLFNNIVIKRKDGKVLAVPIAYGPRQKWLEAHKGLQRDEEMFEKMLPRMSYEMVAMNYDTTRKLTNKQSIIRTPDALGIPRQKVSAPVPYIIDFTLYVETKSLNDGWQIIEQILPFFTPSYVVKVRHFPADADSDTPVPTNSYDMPITMTALTWSDDWTGDLGERRAVEWSMEFSVKVWLYGPVAETSVIFDSRAIVATPGVGVGVNAMRRGSSYEGTEVGYASLKDSEIIVSATNYAFDSDQARTDSDGNLVTNRVVFVNDSDLSPNIVNLQDSDGNIIKVIRDINTL